jgi:hyperosmotically inducible protein
VKKIIHLSKLLSLFLVFTTLTSCAMVGGNCGETDDNSITDCAITEEVRTNIMADPTLSGLEIEIKTIDGVVHLDGLVDSAASDSKISRIARHVAGVKWVEDDLTISQ